MKRASPYQKSCRPGAIRPITFFLISMFSLVASNAATPRPSVVQRFASVVQDDSSTLTLYTDNTFKYESRGDSCWLWHDRKGTWTKQGDLLFLTSTFTVEDHRDGIRAEGNVSDRGLIVVVVSDASGSPLSGARVTFNGHGLESLTGPDGRAVVDYEDIPEAKGYGWCKSKNLEELIVGFQKRDWSFHVKTPQANYFEVALDLAPQSHEETLIGTYKMTGRTLVYAPPPSDAPDQGDFPIWVSVMKSVEDVSQ